MVPLFVENRFAPDSGFGVNQSGREAAGSLHESPSSQNPTPREASIFALRLAYPYFLCRVDCAVVLRKILLWRDGAAAPWCLGSMEHHTIPTSSREAGRLLAGEEGFGR